MKKPKILVVWSNYHQELAREQLESCLQILHASAYDFNIEKVEAGSYEIPSVIYHYHLYKPFDGYIPLSLLLKGETDHYEFILEYIKNSFFKFSMDGLIIGNGIISAPTMELLRKKVKIGERSLEAFKAVDYLIRFKERLIK